MEKKRCQSWGKFSESAHKGVKRRYIFVRFYPLPNFQAPPTPPFQVKENIFYFFLDFNMALNINNVYFENMVSQIYPSELQLNKANASDTEAAFLDLHLLISNDIVSTKIYDKRDDFDFEIVNFPF